MISEKQFDAGGVVLNLVEGQPSGVPLVLLHDLGANWAAHQAMLPALTLGWHVCALDLRGHGKSGRTPEHYRVLDYAQDVIAFIRQYLRAPAAVYGHGFGGLVAIAVAGQATEAVHGLILADPPLFYRRQRITDTLWGEPLTRAYQSLAAAPSTDELARRLSPDHLAGESSGLRARAERLRRVDPDALRAVLEHTHMNGLALGPLLARVSCPTLIIQGDPRYDAVLDEDDAAFARWHLRQFSRVKLEHVGHNLHADAPDTVIQLLETFSREVTGLGVL
ncbi:MAG: alpha/beta hydrolase [Anaerolineales bacterium]|nr:alpha/beta hydrolase [Anaerolineales bacterium]